MTRIDGHDGPYDAPIVTAPQTVLPEWIDYNGHMNVAYYLMAFDRALDEFIEDHLGLGEGHAARTRHGPYALQNSLHYLDELLVGDSFTITVQLVDHDAKRLHIYCEMRKESGTRAAAMEGLIMNVDLNTRRSAAFPDWVMARLDTMQHNHDALGVPALLGAKVGIRRKG